MVFVSEDFIFDALPQILHDSLLVADYMD